MAAFKIPAFGPDGPVGMDDAEAFDKAKGQLNESAIIFLKSVSSLSYL